MKSFLRKGAATSLPDLDFGELGHHLGPQGDVSLTVIDYSAISIAGRENFPPRVWS